MGGWKPMYRVDEQISMRKMKSLKLVSWWMFTTTKGLMAIDGRSDVRFNAFAGVTFPLMLRIHFETKTFRKKALKEDNCRCQVEY